LKATETLSLIHSMKLGYKPSTLANS